MPQFDLPYRVSAHPKWQNEFACTLSPADAAAWAELIAEAKQNPPSDPCVRFKPLPPPGPGDSWVIYWKIREGESRAMLAHPTQTEWVVTLALTVEHLDAVIEKLRQAQSFRLDGAGRLARMSNFNLTVEIR